MRRKEKAILFYIGSIAFKKPTTGVLLTSESGVHSELETRLVQKRALLVWQEIQNGVNSGIQPAFKVGLGHESHGASHSPSQPKLPQRVIVNIKWIKGKSWALSCVPSKEG